MKEQTDDVLRAGLVRLWLEPWRDAHLGWRGLEIWPFWSRWLIEHQPECMGMSYESWCRAFGHSLEGPPSAVLEISMPLSPAWRTLGRLAATPEQALHEALVVCGAVSWFNRPDAGTRWVDQQVQFSGPKDVAHMHLLRSAWRVARVLRVSADGTESMNIWHVDTCVAQGVRMLLGAYRVLTAGAWEALWPHWRWRLAPHWLSLAAVDVRSLEAPVVTYDPDGFERLWAQARQGFSIG